MTTVSTEEITDMSKNRDLDKPAEQEAVLTTIVGGRPPGSGTKLGSIPRGIEVLVKKASVDSEFRALLVERRADAAREIELDLDPAEESMLASIPREQLERIIDRTTVKPESRRVFLGRAAALMLAALGATVLGCGSKGNDPDPNPVRGTQPDPPDTTDVTRGIQPDRPDPGDPPDSTDTGDPDTDFPPDPGTRSYGIRP
jgi:hypothetical protein